MFSKIDSKKSPLQKEINFIIFVLISSLKPWIPKILPKNKSIQGIRNNIASRNYENIFFENDQLNNTFQLKRFIQLKNNKYSGYPIFF